MGGGSSPNPTPLNCEFHWKTGICFANRSTCSGATTSARAVDSLLVGCPSSFARLRKSSMFGINTRATNLRKSIPQKWTSPSIFSGASLPALAACRINDSQCSLNSCGDVHLTRIVAEVALQSHCRYILRNPYNSSRFGLRGMQSRKRVVSPVALDL